MEDAQSVNDSIFNLQMGEFTMWTRMDHDSSENPRPFEPYLSSVLKL